MPPTLTGSEALKLAQGAARVRQLRYTRHAEERMEERNAHAEDVRAALMSATTATWRPKEENWHVAGGKDLDGANLDVGLAIEGNAVRVCTVY